MARLIIELLNACFRDKTLDAMGEFNAHLQQEGRFYHAGTDIPPQKRELKRLRRRANLTTLISGAGLN
jgi:hypothetical protein